MSAPTSLWSRRRAAVAAEEAAEAKAAQEAEIAAQQAELAEKPDEVILEELGLPDPDTLVQGDDFTAFMAKAVPAHLRKRALRTLWRSNPVLACVDGLNDYDDDYLTGSYNQAPIKTSYQVGKGMMAHLVEMDRQAKALLEPSEEAEAAAPQEDVAVAEAETAEALAPQDASPAPEMDTTTETEAEPEHIPAPRRMQFRFEEDVA